MYASLKIAIYFKYSSVKHQSEPTQFEMGIVRTVYVIRCIIVLYATRQALYVHIHFLLFRLESERALLLFFVYDI